MFFVDDSETNIQDIFPLTEKQRTFINEYLVDLNATAAAKRAGYSVDSASEIGYQLLHKTSVQDALTAAMKDRACRTGVDQDRVVSELAAIAFGEASDADGAEVKVSSKLRALELLAKHLGMFMDRSRVELAPPPPEVIPLSRRAALLRQIAVFYEDGVFGCGDDDAPNDG